MRSHPIDESNPVRRARLDLIATPVPEFEWFAEQGTRLGHNDHRAREVVGLRQRFVADPG
jgi:hypothetical protein